MALLCVNGLKECDGCMKCRDEKVYEAICTQCRRPIFLGEARYELPRDIVIHTDCLDDWAKKYRR